MYGLIVWILLRPLAYPRMNRLTSLNLGVTLACLVFGLSSLPACVDLNSASFIGLFLGIGLGAYAGPSCMLRPEAYASQVGAFEPVDCSHRPIVRSLFSYLYAEL